MRDPARIDPMLELLGQIWKKAPDLRLGQILVNATRPSEPVPAIFYVEDDKLKEGLMEFAELLWAPPSGEDGEANSAGED